MFFCRSSLRSVVVRIGVEPDDVHQQGVVHAVKLLAKSFGNQILDEFAHDCCPRMQADGSKDEN